MSKLVKYIIAIAATAAVLFLVWYFSNIVAYILISAVLAIIGRPLVMKLESVRVRGRHIPRTLAAATTLTLIWAAAILFFYIFIPLVMGKLNELSNIDLDQIIESFREPLASLQEIIVGIFGPGASNFSITEAIAGQMAPLFSINVMNDILSSIVSIIGSTAVALFSITFITFFFLREDQLFTDMVVAIFPGKYESNVKRALDSVTNLLMRYFTGIVAESTIMMLLISITLMLFGLKAQTAFFIGLVTGILNVIPYLGPIISTCFCVLIGILSPMGGTSALHMALVIGCTIIGAQLIDNVILQPWLYSNRVNAHPLEIFLVILIAGSVAGVLGMLLAIPAYNVIRVFAKEFVGNFRLVQKLTGKI